MWTNGSHFVKLFEIWTNVRIKYGPVFVRLGLVEPQLQRDHLKSDLQKVCISNVSGFFKVEFWIPTVLV